MTYLCFIYAKGMERMKSPKYCSILMDMIIVILFTKYSIFLRNSLPDVFKFQKTSSYMNVESFEILKVISPSD